ncbi:MAG TPA: aspartate aminotransferase family protein [Ktedonobacterales bacterium]|jgi:acetylornithine aminotransferase/acetylornithine/N-succinyldiaminopimelate aminotransferase|nr:aspartate aminotransferase family protein [Ktedonobacterales bacterium]
MTTAETTKQAETSGNASREWIEKEKKYYQGTFKRTLVMERGEGVRVWDADGKVYLDLVAGIATNVLGHTHPAVVQAIVDQAHKLVHVSNLYINERQVELAEQLYNVSGGMRSFFSNSGAEANEGAIKLARKYGRVNRNGAFGIISMDRSFHGRTLATTAATGQKKYQDTWRPLPDGFKQVPFNDLDALKAATDDNTAGVLIEALQGEGGIYPASKEYMQGLRAWCDEQNLVLICDEVQAGMGRTGKFFSWEHSGIRPDIVTMAKGLAGGVPIGAMLAAPRADIFEAGDHGTTFGGNPIACAAGVATMKTILGDDLIGHAAQMGEYLDNRLHELEAKHSGKMSGVRGLGLMRAFDLAEPRAQEIMDRALEQGVLITNAGPSTIRFVPPLIIGQADLDEAIEKVDAALATL